MKEPEEELWVTGDGTAIKVGDMTDEHVRNALRMLIKQIAKGDLYRLGHHQSKIVRARAGLPPDLLDDLFDETTEN